MATMTTDAKTVEQIEAFFQMKDMGKEAAAEALVLVEKIMDGLDAGTVQVVEPCAQNR